MFNEKIYANLLANTLPRAIETEEECLRVEKIVGELLKKGDHLSPEENELLDLLSDLIENYEDVVYPIVDAPPNEMLKF